MYFAAENGGRKFPLSRASPPKPPAAGGNRPKIARPAPRGAEPPELRRKMTYEWSQAEEADLALGGQGEGGDNGLKHRNGLLGARPSPRATFPNTPSVAFLSDRAVCACLWNFTSSAWLGFQDGSIGARVY